MKHFLLTLGLVATTLGSTYGQTKPKPKVVAKPQAAKPAAAAPAKPSGKPQYAGFIINGKLISELDCYGFDRALVVYPFFAPLNTCDRYTVVVVAGARDKDGKLKREYSHVVARYEGAALDAIREQYAERGYAIAESPDLLADYNAHRNVRPNEEYFVDNTHPAYNILKYTDLDLATTEGSQIFYEIVTSKITSYDTKYSEYDKAVVSKPVYTSSLIYVSPKIPMSNRVLASSVAPPMKAGKMLAKIGKDLVTGGNGSTKSMLPEMKDENCSFKGQDLTTEQVQEVGTKGYGESMAIK